MKTRGKRGPNYLYTPTRTLYAVQGVKKNMGIKGLLKIIYKFSFFINYKECIKNKIVCLVTVCFLGILKSDKDFKHLNDFVVIFE